MVDSAAEAALRQLDARLAQLERLLGVQWFVTPSPARNAERALVAWETQPEATLVTNGRGDYGVLLEVWGLPAGWAQTCPEALMTEEDIT